MAVQLVRHVTSKELDCNAPVQPLVRRAVDLGDAADSEQRLEPKSAVEEATLSRWHGAGHTHQHRWRT
jgi:hypothetical protein